VEEKGKRDRGLEEKEGERGGKELQGLIFSLSKVLRPTRYILGYFGDGGVTTASARIIAAAKGVAGMRMKEKGTEEGREW